MKCILNIFIFLFYLNFYCQNLNFLRSDSNLEIVVADTSTYKIIENKNKIEITDQIRKKITFNRKDDRDYIWEPESGLKILIYRKDE